MATNDESILTETKRTLGIAEADTSFDPDIRMHINSAIGTLNQLGIGPEDGFEVINDDEVWTDLLLTDLKLNPAKSYIFLRVKMLFDPPTTSWTNTAYKAQIEELEWRLNSVREDYIPVPEQPDTALPDEDDWYLDGGII